MFRSFSLALAVSFLVSSSADAQSFPSFRWIQQIDGSNSDSVIGIGTDASGNVYIAGNTLSPDFPVKSAIQGHSASSGLYRIDSPASGAFAPLALNAARAIAVDPQDPQILYASSNGALLRSRDGGTTWSPLLLAPPSVAFIAIDPSNHAILYACSTTQGAFKSTDSGATWTRINSGIPYSLSFPGQTSVIQVWIDPNNSNVIFANANEGQVFGGYRSIDAGATWKVDPNLRGLSSLWFDLATPGLIYATTSANVLKSTDDGQTWTTLGNIPDGLTENTGSLYTITSDPKQPGRLIISTSLNVYESTDDGATFVQRLTLPRADTDFWIAPDWANGALYAQSSGIKRISADLKTITTVGPPALPAVNQIVVANGKVYAAMNASKDIFVTKFDALGNIVYSTFFGGTADDTATAMTVDLAGNVYVTGMTGSADFPITAGAYSATLPKTGRAASFVFKLNPAGSIAYSTYYSDDLSRPSAIAVSAAGEAFIAGTTSGDLPVTPGVFQPAFAGSTFCAFAQPGVPHPDLCIFPVDGFAGKFDSQGSTLMFSTYVGSFSQISLNALAVTIASDGTLFVSAGNNLYHLNAGGTSLLASATAPGPVVTMTASRDGNVYAAGLVPSTNPFTATPGAFQPGPAVPLLPNQASGPYAFLTKYDPSFKQTIASTLLGGGYGDQANSLAIDASGNLLVGGATAPLGFPTSVPLASSFSSGSGFLSLLTPDLSTLLFSTYLGDNEIFAVQSVAIDSDGDFVIAGTTGNASTTNVPTHVWVNKLSAGTRPPLRVDATLNAASRLNTPLSTGETILVRGAGFGSDAQLTIGGQTVPPLSIDSQTITAVIPATIQSGAAFVQVRSGGAASNQVIVPIAAAGPGLFSADGSGVGQGYILNADGTRNLPTNPAKTGDRITVFATGVGPLSFVGPYAVAQFTPEVYVDGFYCTGVAAIAGPVAGMPGTVYQLTVTIPDPSVGFPDLKNFKYPPQVPLILKSNGVSTQIGLAISMAQ